MIAVYVNGTTMRLYAVILSVLCVTVLSSNAERSVRTHVEGEVLVKFRPGISTAATRQIASGHNGFIKRRFNALSGLRGQEYAVIRAPGKSTEELLTALARNPNIELAEPNSLKRKMWPAPPNDTRFGELWGLSSTGQIVNGVTAKAGADIRWFDAWFLTRVTTSEYIVAVIDTGVDYTHPDLAAAMWINKNENPTNGLDNDVNGFVNDYFGYDFAGDFGGPPDPDPMDIDVDPGHGTHVAGTIGSVPNNGFGIGGLHPQLRIMALKASDDGEYLPDGATLAAVDYATMMKAAGWNIVAINASYGGSTFSAIERDAIAAAGSVGIVFCAAAGNDGTNNDSLPKYPASYALSNIIAVAASSPSNTLATFSNFGATSVDIAAPGDQILSTMPAHLATAAAVLSISSNYAANGMTYAGTTTGLTATLHGCGLGYATSFPAAVNGNIALIQRGDLYFSEKASNAMAAGAVGAVIYNNISGPFAGTLQTPGGWFPVVSIESSDGATLLSQGTQTVTLVNAPDPTNAFIYLYGTSMATPHVAGAVAVLAINYPSDSVTQRIARLLSNVHVTNAFTGKVSSGGRLDLARAIDTDRDGLPDWWELEYAGILATLSGAADYDEDSMTDQQEYISGTNPMNEEEFLSPSLAIPGSTTIRLIGWASAATRNYTLEGADAVAGPWSAISSNIAATPPLNTFTNVSGAASFFYRVQIE
jgi:subtilisin family serine protease